VHPKVAQIVLRRDKGDKEDKGDKGGSTEKEKYICQNGMLPGDTTYDPIVVASLPAKTTKIRREWQYALMKQFLLKKLSKVN
jgi:hypothetical protein